MRKWHRWLSVLFGIFMVWIAVTGVLSQVGSLVNESRAAAAPPAATPAGFVCPETMNCRPKPLPGGWNVGLLHHLHSGETFGPVGTAISILSGLALIFFAVSGLWLYVQMFRGRLVRAESGRKTRGGRFFW
jgi:uncharacterized iron-regulated membrane protein